MIGESDYRGKGVLHWKCQCSCEKHTIRDVRDNCLKTRQSTSCGCEYNLKSTRRRDNNYIKTFEQWCKENDVIQFLELWDYDLNNRIPSDVGYRSDLKYYFKCPDGLHKSTPHTLNSLTTNYERNMRLIVCPICNSFAFWGINNICKDFLEKYWDYEKNTVDPWKISKCANKYIWIICQEKNYHGSYRIECSNFNKGGRCSYCTSHKIHKLDSLGTVHSNSLLFWSDKNKKSPYEYSPQTHQEVFWKCKDNEHEDYQRKISESVKCDFRCPDCNIVSVLQEKVKDYILNNYKNFKLYNEHHCSIVPINPKTGRNLPFDNEIFDLKLIIEVHGQQHYEITGWTKKHAKRDGTTPEYELHYQKLKDRYKRFISHHNKYEYLEIPYWTEQDESYKKLIDEKIQEILNKNLEKSA